VTIKLLLLLVLGFGLMGFVVWAIWPRKKVQPGRHNNWQQRDGTEVMSAQTDANGGAVDPVTVSAGTGGAGVF
jgi:Flp pilus assembly protein CpaB